jgi:hypothetical protein
VEHEPDGPDLSGFHDGVADVEGLNGVESLNGVEDFDDAVGLDESVVFEVDPGLDHLAGGLYGDAAAVLDDDPDDLDDAPSELDIDGSLLDSIESELADVERALALLDEGTYGQCEACGAGIDDATLARAPTARFCAEHLPLTLR